MQKLTKLYFYIHALSCMNWSPSPASLKPLRGGQPCLDRLGRRCGGLMQVPGAPAGSEGSRGWVADLHCESRGVCFFPILNLQGLPGATVWLPSCIQCFPSNMCPHTHIQLWVLLSVTHMMASEHRRDGAGEHGGSPPWTRILASQTQTHWSTSLDLAYS